MSPPPIPPAPVKGSNRHLQETLLLGVCGAASIVCGVLHTFGEDFTDLNVEDRELVLWFWYLTGTIGVGTAVWSGRWRWLGLQWAALCLPALVRLGNL